MGRTLALVACLLAAFALAWNAERTPAPAPAGAPTTDFSAARAMPDVEIVAKVPHPVGTPANFAARDYLIGRMTALGLSPQVQRTEVLRQKDAWIAGGTIENLVGVLPGRDRNAPAVALMAHYDSVPGSPGAADDAAGVAAALEIVRALKALGEPARDVVVLLTDAEERGLLGAQAFFDQQPLAGRIGFVVNMEARGGSGRAQMFQTGSQNGGTIDLLRKTAVSPAVTSLTVFLYEHMPNDTDFTVPKAKGIAGLNYAFIGGQFDYHSPTSTPAHLDKGSLQHMGQEALAVTREAAFAAALPAKSPNVVYANTFGGHMLAYPAPVGWAVLGLAAILMAIGAWRARSAGPLSLADVGKGAAAGLYAATLSAALFRLARHATGAGYGFYEQRYLLAQAERWEVALALLGVGAAVLAAAASGRGRTRLAGAGLALFIGLASSFFGSWDVAGLVLGGLAALFAVISFGRPAGVSGAWAGVMAAAFLVGCALQAMAPATAFLVAWPLVTAALVGALTALAARRNLPVLVVLALAGAVSIAWLLSFGHGVYLGLDMPEMLGAVVWLACLGLWPLAHALEDQKGARVTAMAVVLLGVVAVAVVRFDPPWSARYPQATRVAYFVDPAAGRALLVSDLPLTDWTRGALSAAGGKIEKVRLPALFGREIWAARAPMVETPASSADLQREADGAHRLTITPAAGARSVSISISSPGSLTDATLNGRPIKLKSGKDIVSRLGWDAPSGPVILRFRAQGPGEVEVQHASTIEKWPAAARPLPALPADHMAFGDSGVTIVGGARRFTW